MAGFADLERLSHYKIQILQREVDAKDGAVALKGASEAVKARFFSNISERVQKFIKEEMERLGTIAPEEITAIQQRILKQAAQLGKQKQISWLPSQ